MTIFTWAWVDGVQANEVYRAPLLTPTGIEPTDTRPASNFRESHGNVYCCRLKLKISSHANVQYSHSHHQIHLKTACFEAHPAHL